MRPKETFALVKDSVSAWSDDRAPTMGAALSYYALFSIAPLLVIAIAIAGLVFGPEAVGGAVFAQLADLMGADAARAIQEMLAHVNKPATGTLATLGSAVVLLLGASSVFGELQNSLDAIWRAPVAARDKAWWKLIRARLLSFGMVLAFGFLIMVSLLLSTALAALGKWWGPYFGDYEALAHGLDFLVSFVSITVAFALIYKFIPRTPVRWHDVWIGAAVTSALFAVGKMAIGLYLGKSSVGSSFGAFGSLVIVMVWVYYSAQIFLLGAEFTRIYAERFGSRRGATVRAAAPAFAAAANDASAPQTAADAERRAARERVWVAAAAGLARRAPAPSKRPARHYVRMALAAGFLGLALMRRSRQGRLARGR
ncbi:MAG TPA: YihY/virulence factor BrkB family protein [Burkholderiales bacterium]|nr:YihY/virulence factor BrkB family protein [Burkholderiales bacterium]